MPLCLGRTYSQTILKTYIHVQTNIRPIIPSHRHYMYIHVPSLVLSLYIHVIASEDSSIDISLYHYEIIYSVGKNRYDKFSWVCFPVTCVCVHNVHVYMYMYLYMCVCMYMYICLDFYIHDVYMYLFFNETWGL